jgi:hypothetical protein
VRRQEELQHHQQPSQQVATRQLALARSLSPPPLFQRRVNFILTSRGVAGAPLGPSISGMPVDSYRSPLWMFRSYSRDDLH